MHLSATTPCRAQMSVGVAPGLFAARKPECRRPPGLSRRLGTLELGRQVGRSAPGLAPSTGTQSAFEQETTQAPGLLRSGEP